MQGHLNILSLHLSVLESQMEPRTLLGPKDEGGGTGIPVGRLVHCVDVETRLFAGDSCRNDGDIVCTLLKETAVEIILLLEERLYGVNECTPRTSKLTYFWHSDRYIHAIPVAVLGFDTGFECPATNEQYIGRFLKGDLPVGLFSRLRQYVRNRYALLLKITLSG